MQTGADRESPPGARARAAGEWVRAVTLDDALARLAHGAWVPVAGATDFYPARLGRPMTERVLDLGGLADLRSIRIDALDGGAALRIGALATWTALRALAPWAGALSGAAAEIGALQVQNRGTLGGNLCNASPAADGVPPLLALDAVVELASVGGTRRLPLDAFVLGNRRTARREDELLTAVLVPVPPGPARSVFLKLGARDSLVISIAMVAVSGALDSQGRLSSAGAAVGACSAAACRLPALAFRMRGLTPEELARDAAAMVDDAALASLSPIDDVRASAAYRREAARVLLVRAISTLARQLSEARDGGEGAR